MPKVRNGVEELSEKQFDDFVKKGICAIDFWASWCMPCLIMSPVIEEMSEKFRGKINFAKVNVNENKSLASKFDIMSIPCLIVFKEGKEVGRVIGNLPSEQLEEKLRKLVK